MTDSCILETFPDIYKSRTDQRKGQTTAMTDKIYDRQNQRHTPVNDTQQ